MIIFRMLFSCFFFSSFGAMAQTTEADSTILSNEKVDTKAEFKDGERGLFRFLGKNMKYPIEARKAQIGGFCIMGFVVDEKGNIDKITVKMLGFQSEKMGGNKMQKDIELLSPEEKLLVFEGIRVICLMPKWKPAKHKGQNVKVRVSLPIKFRLQ